MIRILYRTCAHENKKLRPHWYTKRRCLISLLAACQEVESCSILTVSDGPLSPDIEDLVDESRCIRLQQLGNGESFLMSFAMATMWNEHDVVYFVEDDYLHTPQSLAKLHEFCSDVAFDYVTLYDHKDRYLPPDHPRADWPLIDISERQSRSHRWRPVESTCMTFAARVATLKSDSAIFFSHVFPGRKPRLKPRDRTLFRHLQGLGVFASCSPRRTLLGAIPSLATHCESEYLAPGVDWNAVAQSVPRMSLRHRE